MEGDLEQRLWKESDTRTVTPASLPPPKEHTWGDGSSLGHITVLSVPPVGTGRENDTQRPPVRLKQ